MAGEHPRDEAFGHVCGRCLQCCRSYWIPVNPYEVARLAGRLGMTTAAFAAQWTKDGGGVALSRQANGDCAFLGPEGCGVYADRPLACRLYPLGLERERGGVERFTRLTLAPRSKGVVTEDGTIRAFLARQDAEPLMEAGRKYFEFYCAAQDVLAGAEAADEDAAGEEDDEGDPAALLMDMDGAIARWCADAGEAEPEGLEARMDLHLRILFQGLEG